MNNHEYKADNYERVAQRFVIPIWQKDELENISLSSTATGITYKGIDYLVLAAHAIFSKDQNAPLKGLGVINAEGKFLELADSVLAYKVFREDDIVICQGRIFDDRLNFDLDFEEEVAPIERDIDCLLKAQHLDNMKYCSWVGFPANKAQRFHNSKTSIENLKTNEYDEIHLISTNAEFRLIDFNEVCVEDDWLDIIEIPFSNKKLKSKREGFKQKGPSLKGMSGGAVFYRSVALIDDINEKYSFEDLPVYFRFAGIGLEFSEKKEVIRACSKKRIIELLEQFAD